MVMKYTSSYLGLGRGAWRTIVYGVEKVSDTI